MMKHRSLALVLSALSLTAVLPACAPLLVGGAAAGTALVVSDRRTSGAIVQDQSNEARITYEFLQRIKVSGTHFTVTSFDGKVLLTGEVPAEAVKEDAGRIAASVVGVRTVVNELAIMPASSLTERSNDLLLAARINAELLNKQNVPYSAVRVVAERGTVYLMGIVTETEANATAAVASRVSGVKSVVKVFEIESAAEIRRRLGVS
jgi:osmotically-inducible protein OsmY